MFNLKNKLIINNIKNHIAMILVLLILIVIFPAKVSARMDDYSKFDWDQYYEQNKYFWGPLCDDDEIDENNNCLQDGVLKHQKKFMVKTYKILSKYQKKGLVISDDLILTTALFQLTPEYYGSPDGNDKYKDIYGQYGGNDIRDTITVDEVEEITDDITEDKFDEDEAKLIEQETDTVKMLIKNTISYYTYCYGVYGTPVQSVDKNGNKIFTCPDGGKVTKIYSHLVLVPTYKTVCADNISESTQAKGYELGFWTYFASRVSHDNIIGRALSIFGVESKDKYYDECESKAGEYPQGTIYSYTDENDKSEKHISYTRYFDFLKETRYFDQKPHLQYYFGDILSAEEVDCLTNKVCSNSLEAKGKYDEYEEQLMADRKNIINQIIGILNDNGIAMQYEGFGTENYNEAQYNTAERSGFYWPVGGDTVESRSITLSDNTTKDILFADGTPQYTTDHVTSYFGERTSPITGEKEMNYGIDIGVPEGTNVIAASDGTVISVVNNCSVGDYECGEGLGNHVIISHSNGDYTVYGHLSSIESQIEVNSQVMRGELIGKSGSTGATKSADLHYELRVGGNSVANAVDPITNTSAGKNSPPSDADLRPSGYQTSGIGARSTRFDGTNLTLTEFSSKVRTYCAAHNGAIAAAMCNNPELVYETSRSANVNPELVITRAMAEGNSPGAAKNNYWGMGCYNTGGYAACLTYSSLEEGIRKFGENVSKYNNLLEMHSKYAYIGAYWYNPGSWSIGGCKYFPYIKEYMSSQRQDEVTAICGRSTECNTGGGDCTPTTPEDQNAYATWQVEKKIGVYMHNVFGT